MFCNKCGTENPDEAMFCSSCGNNMKQNKSGRLKLEKVPEDNVTESVTNEDGDSQDTTDSPETDTKKADATVGVTESLTPDMIPDTFKEKEEKQLAQIVAEMRAENKQAVPKKGWYIYSLMSAIPVAGFIFFAAKKREKNENKKNFAKAGFVINLILSLVILITAGVILYFSFGGKITLPKKHTEKVTEAVTKETKTEETSSAVKTTTANTSSGTAQQTSPVKKTEPVKSYSYDKNSKTFTFELNGNTFKYPVSAAAIKDLGYIYVSNTLSSETTTLDMYTDAYKSTIMVKYNAKAGNTSDCYALAAELKEGSTFMGLSARTDYATLKEAFKNADREVQTDYRSDTGTGIIQYMFGDRRISVTMDNGYVTGATIE